MINWISAVHVVYKATHDHIHWFGQLTSHIPGILVAMMQKAEPEEEQNMVWDKKESLVFSRECKIHDQM